MRQHQVSLLSSLQEEKPHMPELVRSVDQKAAAQTPTSVTLLGFARARNDNMLTQVMAIEWTIKINPFM